MQQNRWTSFSWAIVAGFLGALAGCGGGGGGGDDVEADPGNGGVGTGADGVTIFWQKYGTAGSANAVVPCSDGGFFIAGNDGPAIGEPADILLLKTDPSGAVQWQNTIDGGADERANSAAATADGGFIVCGVSIGESERRFVLLKIDGSGNLLEGWPKFYPDASLNGAHGVIETRDGSGDATGYAMVGSDVGQDTVLIRTDLAGNELPRRTFPTAEGGWDAGYALLQTADGGFAIAGVNGTPSGADVLMIRTDADGNALSGWPKNLGAGMAYGMHEASDGFVLTGTTTNYPFDQTVIGDLVVLKVDGDGTVLWRKTFGGAEHDEGRSVDLAADGSVIVAGSTCSFGDGSLPDYLRQEIYLIKLTAGGDTVFQKVKGKDESGEGAMAVRTVTGCGISDCGCVIAGGAGLQALLTKTDKLGDTVELGEMDVSITVPSTTGAINFANAHQVSGAAKNALMMPIRAGEFAMDLLVETLKGNLPSEVCDGGGTAPYALTPPPPIAAGHVFHVTFGSCVSGPVGPDRLILDGDFSLRVNAVTGDPQSADYSLSGTLRPIDLSITDDVGTTDLGGALVFSRTSSAGRFVQTAADENTLSPFTIASEGATRSLSAFSLGSTLAPGGAFQWGKAGETASLMATDVTAGGTATPLTLTIVEPVTGSAQYEPTSGKLRLMAADGSGIWLTISATSAAIEVDADGDGKADGTMATSWDDL